MTRERKATVIRKKLEQLEVRYAAARRLSRRNEMNRLSREMTRLMVELLRVQDRMEKAA